MEEEEYKFNELHLAEDDEYLTSKRPYLHGSTYLINGEIREWQGPFTTINSPIYNKKKPKEPIVIGDYPMMDEKTALEAVEAAHKAFNNGRGVWPTAHVSERIKAVEMFAHALKSIRPSIVDLIMWEICKTKADAEKEVDRTIQYIFETIATLKKMENGESTFTRSEGIISQCRRAPIGVVLCSGPFNYPFNETYCTLIPAIIMGNSVVMKLPRVGVLCHWPTWPLFQQFFPAGVVNVVSGSGRSTLPPIMRSGKIDIFGFIGTSQAADALQSAHPKPHRLRVCLGLEAKNPAIIFPDADLNIAISETVLGSLSFNGQRCTAIKIIFVHNSIIDQFLAKFCESVDNLKMGLPWEEGVKITPLPEEGKPGYLRDLIADAIANGAQVVNKRGNQSDRSFVAPTVLYPTTPSMRVYHEEQFGPLIPIYSWQSLDEIYDYISTSNYGQQASIFSTNHLSIAPLIDILVNQVSRVNINCQCQRGPDILPFTGRKDSAYGTLSVFDALRVFSIRALVAAKDIDSSQSLVNSIVENHSSNFLRLDYIF